ncbi:MAG: DUF4445 domain-containing protein [Crenarchaeota archaeon]|nr:DUF4445 domain-containing protein [Thermoproteota archaeon]
MVTVIFEPYGRRVEVSSNETILDAAMKCGVVIRSICGGKGACKKCKVRIDKGEVKLLSEEAKLDDGTLLACQIVPVTDCVVYVPEESRLGVQKVLHKGKVRPEELDPWIRKEYKDGKVVIIYREDGRVIDERDKDFKPLGLAIDIGSTKVVTYLVDLETGRVLAEAYDINKQVIYGDDLMSRIEYCIRNKEGYKDLHRAVISCINDLVRRLVAISKTKVADIVHVVAAGNTVMTYLFLGRDVRGFADTHFEVEKGSYRANARDLGLLTCKNAPVYCLPCVGRFLGGDIIGDILTSGMWKSDDIQLLIDIGTNTHVVVGCRDWYIATTGPGATTFEGYGVRYGMKAMEGAIERVVIRDGKVEYQVIGNVKPIGICGSGLIDLLAELFVNKIIDSQGKLRKNHPNVVERDGKLEFIVVPASESGTGRDITIDEQDIKNLLESKASVCALITTLLKKVRLDLSDIKRVYICGAFANYLDLNNAVKIGMIPEFPNAEIEYIGNGSIAGAYLVITNYKYRDVVENIAENLTYIEMINDSDFVDEYIAATTIPGKKEYFPTVWSLVS